MVSIPNGTRTVWYQPCVPRRLSPVASMAPGDVCHGLHCSLAGLGPPASGYCPCCWPGGSAGSPQCARPMGCGLLLTAPRSPWVRTCVRCPGPLCSCSPVCPLGALCCVCGVLGHSAPVHRCVRLVRCDACAVSRASLLLFTGVPALCVALFVWCPGPLGSCSPVCPHGGLCCVCGFLGHLAPVHRCACLVRCVVCAVFWATWLLFTDVLAQCGALRVRRPGPLGSCAPVCLLGALCCVCGVLGHLAPILRRAHSVRCGACTVSWATWLLLTSVPTRCVAVRVRCTGPLGSCSPACSLAVLCCVCGVLGHFAPVHGCGRSVRCVACAVSEATWLLFTGVPAWCVVFRVWCPGPLGSCSPVCSLGVLSCVCGVLGYWLLFAGVSARCVALRVWCLGVSAPFHPCVRSLRCVACAVSWAPRLPSTGVLARCVVFRVWCPRPLGSCSPVCSLGVLCCVCGVLGHWLLFAGVSARCVVLRVRCPGPIGSSSPVSPRGVLCCVCGVLGHLAPVHWCACPVGFVACAVSSATWLLFTGVPASGVVMRVRCPGPDFLTADSKVYLH